METNRSKKTEKQMIYKQFKRMKRSKKNFHYNVMFFIIFVFILFGYDELN